MAEHHGIGYRDAGDPIKEMAMAGSVANGQGQLIDYRGRLLNHMNLAHRPGERQLVSKLFIALGCEVRDTGEPYVFISITPGNKDLLRTYP